MKTSQMPDEGPIKHSGIIYTMDGPKFIISRRANEIVVKDYWTGKLDYIPKTNAQS